MKELFIQGGDDVGNKFRSLVQLSLRYNFSQKGFYKCGQVLDFSVCQF